MTKIINRSDWPLVRFIVPAFPEVNIFTRQAQITTALGPIMVATVANKLWGWRVEVIDENNYRGPRNHRGLPDHPTLQTENPAAIVGFYCGLTSTMERVWQLAEFYRREGAATIAGGWHAHYCPQETLKNNIDVVVHGDGEVVIQRILKVLQKRQSLQDIPGISYLEDGEVITNRPEVLEVGDLNDLPYPDFGLLRYAKMKLYPIGRIRGCSMNCEFCSVRGNPRWATGHRLFRMVKWLVETRRARRFFIVDDRLEQDLEGTIEFFKRVSEKYGTRLVFTVQIRLEAAKNTDLLEAMKKAGVRTVCVGYESPIDKELQTMRKGYSADGMIRWTKVLRQYFWIHAMFIVGYPAKRAKSASGPKETVKQFKKFIRKASPDTVQILLPVPIPGSDLRQRLQTQKRVFPIELVPYSMYDGTYPCFIPDNMTVRQLQEIPVKLMRRFYNPFSFIKIALRTVTFPMDCLIRGWRYGCRDWCREVIRYQGHRLLQRWRKRHKGSKFVQTLENYGLKSR